MGNSDSNNLLRNSKTVSKYDTDNLFSKEYTLILMDSSASMENPMKREVGVSSFCFKNPFATNTRFSVMRNTISKFLVNRRSGNSYDNSNDKLALIEFASSADIIAGFSSSHDEKVSAVSMMGCSGSTDMAGAFELVGKAISNLFDGFIRIILISDGDPNSTWCALAEVKRLIASYGIIIDTIGVGDFGSYEEFLKELARLGEGTYTKVSSADELDAVLLKFEAERALLIGSGIKLLGAGDEK